MKKLSVVFITIILFLFNTVPAFFAGTVAIISSEDIWIEDKTVLVPVTISDNPGIMGFRITVEYPSDLLEISDATAGNVTAVGSFIHSAGKTSGTADIIWFSTEQTTNNGTLFVLTVKATSAFKQGESAQITLSFSQADTFNEQYEDVEFECKPINIVFGKPDSSDVNDPQESIAETKGTPEETQNNKITDAQIITAVEAAMESSGIENIDDIDEEVLNKVNENLKTITGFDGPFFSNVEELKSRYKEAVINEYSAQAEVNIDPDRITGIIDEALNSKNADSFDDLSDQDKEAVVGVVLEKLNAEDDTLPDISKKLSIDDTILLFEKMHSKSKLELNTGQSDAHTTSPFPVIIAIIVACVIVVVFILIWHKRKQTNKI